MVVQITGFGPSSTEYVEVQAPPYAAIAVRWLLDALPSSPVHPVPNQFVFGHGRGAGFEDSYQAASL